MEEHVYDEFSKLEKSHWWFVGRRFFLKNVISRHEVRSNAPCVLEVGCGTGGNIELLSQFGDFSAIEMSAKAVKLAQLSNPSHANQISQGSLPDHNLADRSFDKIFLLDVLEHIEDDTAALKALKALLKKNGQLYITVPAYQWLWSDHDIQNQHKRRYTLKRIRALLKSLGFDVAYSSYFNTLLFPLAAIERLSQRLKSVFGNSKSGSAALDVPVKPINQIFQGIFRLEGIWAGRLSIPFGLSIVLVATNVDET